MRGRGRALGGAGRVRSRVPFQRSRGSGAAAGGGGGVAPRDWLVSIDTHHCCLSRWMTRLVDEVGVHGVHASVSDRVSARAEEADMLL